MLEKATFAAGCFWGVESVFEQVPGVVATRVGYTGGHTDQPTYEQVCSHATGHAEAVEVTYDPAQVTYDDLLNAFWINHDPTQLNRQGWDVGDNYRSAIYYHSPEQQQAAERSKEQLETEHRYRKPVVTQIAAAQRFWPAEEYHQKYYSRRGMAAACKLA
ncbi:MAG: peptide-methionine (S)-S-oxide reductase MsrA [Candidatus Dormibacteria bacterium]